MKTNILTFFLLLGAGLVIAWQYQQTEKLKAAMARPGSEGLTERGSVPGGLLGRSESTRMNEDVSGSGKKVPAIRGYQDLQAILGAPDPMGRMKALLEFAETLPSDQLGAVLKKLRATKVNDPESQLAAHLLLTRWGMEDPDAAFASLGKFSSKRGGGEARGMLASLASVQPERAGQWLTNPENGMVNRPYLGPMLASTIAREWARSDSAGALAWADDLNGKQRASAFSAILGNLASSDPAGAAQIVMEMDEGDRSGAIREISESWARVSSEEAVEWARSLEGDDRIRALEGAVESLAEKAPRDAAALVDQLEEGNRDGAFIGDVVRNWATTAPSEAAEWLATQPESEGKVDSMGHLMWNWTRTDPETASTWLSDQPEGASRDQGVAGLSKAAFDQDPESAVGWALTISEEGMRHEMLQYGVRRWMDRSPDEARSWAAKNGVDVPVAGAREFRRDGK
ncbi:MAG: hypothetical protein AAF514_05410 [Verrucomicrobiota bacterium]